uniref:Carboxylesterase type B domain-containing protein n=1 Tax=Parascaris univalens TaxID=6257 RepID=A0A915CH71_PARUN
DGEEKWRNCLHPECKVPQVFSIKGFKFHSLKDRLLNVITATIDAHSCKICSHILLLYYHPSQLYWSIFPQLKLTEAQYQRIKEEQNDIR